MKISISTAALLLAAAPSAARRLQGGDGTFFAADGTRRTKQPTPAPTPPPTTSMATAPTYYPTYSPTGDTDTPTYTPTPGEATATTVAATTAATTAAGSTDAATTTEATYVPGELTTPCDRGKLMLSTGLDCQLLTTVNRKVALSDWSASTDTMHGKADGAAVIPHPTSGGWYYMSNSEESSGDGGVGTLEFDGSGNVIGYERQLSGTSRNCGVGRTPWDTLVTCEENGSAGKFALSFFISVSCSCECSALSFTL